MNCELCESFSPNFRMLAPVERSVPEAQPLRDL